MTRNPTLAALIFAAGVATAGGVAYAAQAQGENDAVRDVAAAKITLAQAIAAAEQQHAGGKVTRAELETEKGRAVYDVEIIAGDQKVYDVKVSAADGQVLSSQMDKHDGERDDND